MESARVSQAMKLLVAGYVKMRDRRALEARREARRKVLGDLQSVTGISKGQGHRNGAGDLAAIEVGLEELKPLPGTGTFN